MANERRGLVLIISRLLWESVLYKLFVGSIFNNEISKSWRAYIAAIRTVNPGV